MKKVLKAIISIPKYIALGLILLFKFCISPFIPHTCKFTPTCSQYASESFAQWGFFIGLKLTISRLCRCNPFNKQSGLDKVPINPKKYYKNLM